MIFLDVLSVLIGVIAGLSTLVLAIGQATRAHRARRTISWVSESMAHTRNAQRRSILNELLTRNQAYLWGLERASTFGLVIRLGLVLGCYSAATYIMWKLIPSPQLMLLMFALWVLAAILTGWVVVDLYSRSDAEREFNQGRFTIDSTDPRTKKRKRGRIFDHLSKGFGSATMAFGVILAVSLIPQSQSIAALILPLMLSIFVFAAHTVMLREQIRGRLED